MRAPLRRAVPWLRDNPLPDRFGMLPLASGKSHRERPLANAFKPAYPSCRATFWNHVTSGPGR